MIKNSTILISVIVIGFFHNSFAQIHPNRIQQISDSIFEKHLTAREYLTGGVISVVHENSTLLLKGYGQANREKNVSFDPATTIVQIASVTKLITTTALLQLVDAGKIDLEKPVDFYLQNLSYANPYDKKVLVKNLLTHTGGFDDRSGFMESRSIDEVPSLQTYAENYIPAIVWEPGKYFNYSNYSFVLAAYLVEAVSNTPFEIYVDQNILQPLDMTNSGFGNQQNLKDNLMIRYRLRENQNNEIYTQKADPRYTNLKGVTGFKTTAEDMANFMMMYLNEGVYNGKQILKKETIHYAFSSHFTYDDKINRQQGLGWRIEMRGGKKMLYHHGDDTGVESSLVLFSEKKIGVFTAFNNPVGFEVKTEIQDAIYRELYGSVNEKNKDLFSAKTSLKKIVGSYFYMNDSHTTFEKIGFLLGNKKIIIEAIGDTLQIGDRKFMEINTPLLFQEIEGNTQVKFIKDKNGEINHYSYGTSTFRKISQWEDPSFHLKIIIGCLAVFIIFLITALVRFFKTKFSKRKDYSFNRALGLITINTLCVVLFVLFFVLATNTISTLSYGIDFFFKALFIFPVLALMFLPISGYFYFKETKALAVWFKMLLLLDITAILCFLLILNSYNLIGFNFV